MNKIKIAVADDYAIFRDGLAITLSHDVKRITVVIAASHTKWRNPAKAGWFVKVFMIVTFFGSLSRMIV